MSGSVSVNGQITDERQAVISVFDHGFLYGEGVYETLRTYHGRPFLLDRHLKRLRHSARMISLDVPLTDSELGDRIAETVARAGPNPEPEREWYIRILLTRGIGELSYDPAATPAPSVVIIVKPLIETPPELQEKGVRAVISSIVRNHPGSVDPMIKSNNLMNNALAMQEGLRRGAFEVIMRNYRGELTECSMSNLFVVKNGAVLTPPLSAGLLPGITREVIFEIGSTVGAAVREETLYDDDLFGAEEVFLTGTTRELLPIVEVDGRKIASGLPGPITKKLRAEFQEWARATSG